MLPDWQLPPGVDRGLWDYVSSERVAREYDLALAGTPLLEFDLQFAERHVPRPGRLIDLGCGTGRLCVHFAHKGFACLAVDLSEAMLDEVQKHAVSAGVSVERLKANLVELNGVASDEFDYAACMFSTLGMLRGEESRKRFLQHVRRILKPGGVFVLHAHNARYRFGFGLGEHGAEKGDRTMPQARGGADLTIHHFTKSELMSSLTDAGFRVETVLPVSTTGKLSASWFFPGVRAYGFLVAART